MRDQEEPSLGQAPGSPGISPTWTSSAKDIVGCALGRSRVWFTLGFGIINEVYYPQVDIPQIRDLGFIIVDGRGFWVEVKRLENYPLRLLAPGTPAVEIVHSHERFRLTLRVTPDPDRDVLLIEIDLAGHANLRPYVLLAPRLGPRAAKTPLKSNPTERAACLRANKVRSVLLWRRSTNLGRTHSAQRARDMSVKAMVGRIFNVTAH
jgi:hypothetical protein